MTGEVCSAGLPRTETRVQPSCRQFVAVWSLAAILTVRAGEAAAAGVRGAATRCDQITTAVTLYWTSLPPPTCWPGTKPLGGAGGWGWVRHTDSQPSHSAVSCLVFCAKVNRTLKYKQYIVESKPPVAYLISAMSVVFLCTGGTIDKLYPRTQSGYAFEFGSPAVERVLGRVRPRPAFPASVQSVCRVDSQVDRPGRRSRYLAAAVECRMDITECTPSFI